MSREEMRAGDADREAVATRLQAALQEGRIDLGEFDERVQRSYAARTYGDLDRLLTDLPPTAAQQVEPLVSGAEEDTPHATREWLVRVWGTWAFVVAINVGVWGLVSFLSDSPAYFWPAWVGVPWGFLLLITTVGGLMGGAPQKMVDERRYRDFRRQRRALRARAIESGELPPNPTKEQRRLFDDQAIARGDLPPRPPKSA